MAKSAGGTTRTWRCSPGSPRVRARAPARAGEARDMSLASGALRDAGEFTGTRLGKFQVRDISRLENGNAVRRALTLAPARRPLGPTRDKPLPITTVDTPPAKLRIYLVDDHALFLRGLQALLSAEPDLAVIGEAKNCAVATNDIIRLRPDVVVTDLILSGNNGLELIKNIRAFDQTMRIVVLSAYSDSGYALRAIKAGANAYVSKRDAATTVVNCIRNQQLGTPEMQKLVDRELADSVAQGRSFATTSPVDVLTDRELEVVTLLGGGLDTSEIAQRLRVSEKTVSSHRLNIKTKLKLPNAVKVVHFCTRWAHESQFGPV